MPDLISILSQRPVSIMITAATMLISSIAFKKRYLYLKWILHPLSMFRHREFYRPITMMLVHNDLMHLLINCLSMLFICGELETYLNGRSSSGSLYFLLIYLFSHFAGVTVVSWVNRSNYGYSSAGASGGVLGCMIGFMILAPKRIAFYLPVLGPVSNQYASLIMILGLLVYKWRSGNDLLDNELHFYSAVGGGLITLILFPGSL